MISFGYDKVHWLQFFICFKFRHIITAAHCVTDMTQPGLEWFQYLIVQYGIHRKTDIFAESTFQQIDPGSDGQIIEKKKYNSS